MLRSVNPATGEFLAEYPEDDEARIGEKLQLSESVFVLWKKIPITERSALMKAAADELRSSKSECAELMTKEMGKPIGQAEAEAEKCAWVCDFYAEQAGKFLSPEFFPTDAAESFVRFDPIGPVLAVMPWNFPFWQVFRFAAPNLMAGNVGLLKHASNVPGCALAIEEIFARAGFPKGVFQSLMVRSGPVKRIIGDPTVRAVTLTGSDPAGRAVASEAGANIKKSVLELGGSDPFIVLADADVEDAARKATTARTINNGQSCIAAKRFIVEKTVADAFEEAFVSAMANLRVGDPMDPSTDVGPLARLDLLEDLSDQVERSVAHGAEVALGGGRLNQPGFFFEPTVLTNVSPDNPAFREETFGPLAAVVRAENTEEAVALANLSDFGLGASVWTMDVEKGKDVAAQIEAGAVFVNGIVKSDPRLPFGGVKHSGYGRELGLAGIREFVNAKTVYVE